MDNLAALEHTLNVFNKRLFPGLLFCSSPEKFSQWQGNHCKQSAILNSFIIEHFVGNDYKITAWEGFFTNIGIVKDVYNHCWNYLEHKTNPELNIIADFTNTITYMCYGENNPTYFVPNLQYKSVVKDNPILLNKVELDIPFHLKQNEFYTGMTGIQLQAIIKNLLIQSKLWI